ncbi:HAMP domain-containing histidine kinase [Dysgonomonas sp. HDW5A]|uniref:sensor histidine kinase n=1 Tax=Dysgonomonas sp. HDW5A TaxID=2714926 RepID=UPI0014084F78|nr:HAMP domain-containing sensor histidine kinase [Dysgonomonas sp. HDW5A]QIK59739.1 HAMP domain-containing histidine kinase [Dysgonomonas sp. HDW5A]
MKNQFIKIITCIAIISILVLQGIWLYNTYTLLEKELVERLDNVLSLSIEKEVYLRLKSPGKHKDNGKIVEGAHPENDPETNALAFQEFLYSEGSPLNFTRLDSVFYSIANKNVGKIDYYLEKINNTDKTSVIIEHGISKDASPIFYTKTMPIRMDKSESIKVVVISPYKMIFEKMTLLLIGSGLIAIIIGYCIFLQVKIIIRQNRIAEIRKDFTYAMIHDMKNPLTTILMGAQTLKTGKLDDKPDLKEQYFNILVDESNHLLTLSNRILTIARLEHNKMKLTKQLIDLPRMINSLIEKFNIEPRKCIDFHTNFNNVEYVYADPEYLSEIIRNLIENSIKYSRETVRINISSISDGQYTKIVVWDNGVGISLKNQKKIFDKFERASFTNSSAGPTGFGLGLNYVYRVITAHGGEVIVNSILGSFSEFTISIPNKDEKDKVTIS